MTPDQLLPATPADELTIVRNEVSACLYGEYYYELPNGGKGARAERDTVDNLMYLIVAHDKRSHSMAVIRTKVEDKMNALGDEGETK